MLLTICTLQQLSQAFALGDSFCQHTNQPEPVLIGLVDDPAHLPPGFVAPYPLVPVTEILSATELQALSAQYTPTEFAAACKPAFIKEAFRRYGAENRLIVADPNLYFTASLAPVWEPLNQYNALITPMLVQQPSQPATGKTLWPDEKYFQNVGLYSADFLAFRRSEETDRLLAWWDDRVRSRAQIDFCAGLCLDQLWLMHVPVFFPTTKIIRHEGWHIALWNLSERMLRQEKSTQKWWVKTAGGQEQPLQFVNFKGIFNRQEGLFIPQNRIDLNKNPIIQSLLSRYRTALAPHSLNPGPLPAYGEQPEPGILLGWRSTTVKLLRTVTGFIDQVYLPAIK